MKRSVLLLAGAVVGLSACDSLKEAMTAHVDTVAQAGSQELSVERLATVLGEAPLPLQKDVAKAVASVWVNYQLLAQAALEGDSLSDSGVVRAAMWQQIANIKANKFMETVSREWQSEPTPVSEADYAQGSILAASHILVGFPQTSPNGPPAPPTDAVRDSVRRRAEELHAQVTTANFADMAREHSTDTGSGQQGGSLGVFPAQQMVPEFARGVQSIRPGEISRPVLSPFGYHIILRTPFAQVDQQQLAGLTAQLRAFQKDSAYRAELQKAQRVSIRPNVAKTVKAVAEDPDAHRRDETVLATYNKGELTAGRLAQWVMASPPQQQMRQQIASAPDSVVPRLIEELVFFELIIAQADSAKVQVDSTQENEMARAFVSAVTGAWQGLGVAPAQLADSAQSDADKRSLAASRVDRYFTALVKGEAPFVQVPPPVESALREKYSYKVNDAGIERALEMATRVRAKADSARAMAPPSAVPMPGGAPQGAPQPGPQGAPAVPPQGPPPAPPAGGAPPAGR